jgi:phospholipid/cholesterol/gamma-HCH transport system substrate-binding protein
MRPEGTRAGFWENLGNRLLAFWRYLRTEGRTGANVIVFLIIAGFLIVALVFTLFRVQPHYSIYATFADSGGVFTNQEVTYRGVTVGRVGRLQVVPNGVRMQLIVESKFGQIPKRGTKARVMFKSAVGEQFVDLLPATRVIPPYFHDQDEIAIGATELPVQQEELLRLLDRVLSGVPPESLHRLVEALGEGLGGRGAELHDALAALDPLTKTLAGRTDELNDLAVTGDKVGNAFDASADDFVRGVQGLGEVSGALGRGSAGLADLLRAGATDVPEIGSLVAARKTQIDTTIAGLATITRISYQHLQSVKDTLDWLPLLLDSLVESYDVGTNRFRFGQILGELRNPPCSYGTPRRSAQERNGNAPYQPILDFNCVGQP